MNNKSGEIIAYKTFKENLMNKYGVKFEIGEVYTKDSKGMKFGEHGHGYHMATSAADTFRFFKPNDSNICCKVMGFGKIVKSENVPYNCGDMFVAEKFKIIKALSREDIISLVYQADIQELARFLALYPFKKEELIKIKEHIKTKGNDYDNLFTEALTRQTGEISSFKRDTKYLRKVIM